MQNLTRFLVAGCAAFLLITSVEAGDGKTFKDKIVVEEECRFRDYEWQVDLFYTAFWAISLASRMAPLFRPVPAAALE